MTSPKNRETWVEMNRQLAAIKFFVLTVFVCVGMVAAVAVLSGAL